ncbi:MAG: CpsD/CapB family tyrosine-protein kinase [Burkholderiaceae bacterium]
MSFNKIERAMALGAGNTKPAMAATPKKSKARAEARGVSKARQSRKSMRASPGKEMDATQVAEFGSTDFLSNVGPLTEPFGDSVPELTREEVRALVKRETRRRRQLKQTVEGQRAAVNDPAASEEKSSKQFRQSSSTRPGQPARPVERRVRNEPRVAKLERRVRGSDTSFAAAPTEPFDTVVHSIGMTQAQAQTEPTLDSSTLPGSTTNRLRAESVTPKRVKMRKDRQRTGAKVKLNLEDLFAQGYLSDGGKPGAHGKKGSEAKPLPLLEEFRRIKRPLLANAFGQGLPAAVNGERIMITSALPSEGKSFCAIHLALSIASEVDTSVLLVEADVAKPTVLSKLDLPRAKGLSNWFADPRLDVRDLTLSTNIPGLKILPAGMEAPDSIDMLASRAMASFFDRLREAYPHDLIIVDAPPLLPATETKVLATNMGQVVVVVEAGETSKTVLADALEMLKDIEIVGLVLNKSLRQPKSAGYGYGYGY